MGFGHSFTAIDEDVNCSNPSVVDPGGFEPPTSSLRTKRATNCAMGPERVSTIPHAGRAHRDASADSTSSAQHLVEVER